MAKLAVPWLLLLALGTLTACRRDSVSDEASPRATAPRRLVVLAPSAAETLVTLGRSGWIVGRGEWVVWPPEVGRLPSVGGYDRPNLERVVELGADLLVTTTGQAGREARAKLASLGVELLELDTSTYSGSLTAIRTLGERVGRGAEAAALVGTIEARIETLRARAEGAARRSVLVVVGRQPLYVAGPGSHLDALVSVAGGDNLLADALSPYQMVSLEVVLARRPEVIVELAEGSGAAPPGRAPGAWKEWPFLPAVANDRVFSVDSSRLAVPGPRLAEMAELLAKVIHPERFGEPSAVELGPLAEGS